MISYIDELRACVGHRPLILVGISAMIFNNDHKLLLQLRSDDHLWDLPGGFMELGESTEETARREIREETGLEVGKLTLFNVFAGKQFFYSYPNGDQVFAVNPLYVTNDAYGTLHLDRKESSDLRYFSINELPCEMLPQIKMIIESYFETGSI